MPQAPLKRCTLYDTAEVGALLDDMARRAAALLAGRDAVIVGILRRGAPLAALLRERLERDHGIAGLPSFDVKIQRYSDDLRLLHPETLLTEDPAHAGLDLAGRCVLLVDDVLYRGHSLLRALDWAARRGAAEVRVAVLADRNVNVLPVHADIVGAHLQLAPDDVVECHVPPYESELSVELVRPRR
ncbi:phosphoribosyltransferase family protein [Quisquiliibacterium transsilvanicum]|uniref:Pyrimidine operon attenuation protein/uracil phosphoribosyltransferase n=1 Tax=Quisquiliibacterium transsilvanicum TaxID=1549638 RepID=A0A7W8HI60_9BURK|nr:phosphoribosyltransferase family protein [Quisquiliibacterium transsilvanicum]MBB5272506.1 pyrimidine operon attenuation protein/uracil phosphoribosyltransferase [Quisquiliibacterium transsilvanicum]